MLGFLISPHFCLILCGENYGITVSAQVIFSNPVDENHPQTILPEAVSSKGVEMI